MIRVMIVDDEPFIRKGLQILINWEQQGYQICGEASNGMEAIELLKEKDFDLIITDIKMPKLDGINLIGYVKENITKDIGFIILSGFYEYDYAKKAIRYGVEDYLLKPVQKEELIHLLLEYRERYLKKLEEQKHRELTEKIVFDNYVARLLTGLQIPEELEYIRQSLLDDTEVRYIGLEYEQSDEAYHRLSDEEKLKMQTQLYEAMKNHMGEQWYHVFLGADGNSTDYLVGFLYVKKLADREAISEREYIHKLHEAINRVLSRKTILFIGQKVPDITVLSDSYKSAMIARNFQHFSNENDITFYDELRIKDDSEKQFLYIDVMDELIRAIEENNEESIMKKTDAVYRHFKDWVADSNIIKINLDYLLYNLIDLIKKLEPDFDPEKIYRMISLGGKEQGAVRGSVQHIRAFSMEFAQYINQLRQNNFGGVLTEIDREIAENYAEGLNLKSLGEKYYINSAYLGQIFKKKYGVSFKDYLNSFRIERAAELLLRSDKKVYLIAEEVGFNNTDYFISKFVQLKGVTPLQYRKQTVGK